MITAVAFVVAAAGGALARAEAGRRWNGGTVPVGTLVVNVTGAFLLGLLDGVTPPMGTVAGTAALGAFTTFSSFARDAAALAEERRWGLAVAYVTLTYAAGIAAAAGGLAISRS